MINDQLKMGVMQRFSKSEQLFYMPHQARPIKVLCDIISLSIIHCTSQAVFDKINLKARFYLVEKPVTY